MSTARVDFTRGAAERIARAVRIVEQGQRDQAGPRFGRVVESSSSTGSPIKLGSFTGSWPKGELKTVTLHDSTATYSVKNVSVPIDENSDSPNAAGQRTVLFSYVSGTYHAVEIEQGGICGSWKDYLVSLNASCCFTSSPIAIVRSVDAVETDSDSGTGPITKLELLSNGGFAKLGRVEPVVNVSADSTNVTFSLSYSETTQAPCELSVWSISGATAYGSTSFWTPQALTVSPGDGVTEESPAEMSLSTAGVSITSGGVYYKESTAAQPYTATISISISQESPSDGSGASFTPTVDTSAGSPSFGQITSLTIDNGGTDYIAWKWSGSVPFGPVDLADFPGFKAYATQILGHEKSCLKWFDITTCGTSTATP